VNLSPAKSSLNKSLRNNHARGIPRSTPHFVFSLTSGSTRSGFELSGSIRARPWATPSSSQEIPGLCFVRSGLSSLPCGVSQLLLTTVAQNNLTRDRKVEVSIGLRRFPFRLVIAVSRGKQAATLNGTRRNLRTRRKTSGLYHRCRLSSAEHLTQSTHQCQTAHLSIFFTSP